MQYDKKKVSSKIHMHIKTHNLILISNPLKKLQNTQAKKLSTKKWEKNGVFDFYYCVRNFSVSNFLGVNFLTFFQRIRTQHRILRFRIPISNFCKTKFIFLKVALFANCKVKRGRNKAKNIKSYVINVSYSSISGLGGSILSKKSTLFCPKIHCTMYITF